MIFRIDGEVGELLALTPVIREWKKRHLESSVLVETNNPIIFWGNTDVLMASRNIGLVTPFYDMNYIRWRELGVCVAELYADHILGDRCLSTWKIVMSCSQADVDQAKQIVRTGGKPKVATGFDHRFISKESEQGILEAITECGYDVVDASIEKLGSWGLVYAVIGFANLFVGSDGDSSAIALTTDRPAIVCYSYRSPFYFPPFRMNIPFVPIVPDKKICEHSAICHARHSHIEFAKLYSQGCIMENQFCCMNRVLKQEVVSAIESIGKSA